jgi:hypothetical protein
VVYFWVHIARRIMTCSETEASIASARGGLIEKELSGSTSPSEALSEKQREQISDAFKLFDVDGDGRIELNELKVSANRFWQNVGLEFVFAVGCLFEGGSPEDEAAFTRVANLPPP